MMLSAVKRADEMRMKETTHPQNNYQNSTSLISKFTVSQAKSQH
jgi:hypothetical protein